MIIPFAWQLSGTEGILWFSCNFSILFSFLYSGCLVPVCHNLPPISPTLSFTFSKDRRKKLIESNLFICNRSKLLGESWQNRLHKMTKSMSHQLLWITQDLEVKSKVKKTKEKLQCSLWKFYI